MAHAEASARTVEAAVAAAATQLGLRSDQVDVEVLEEPVPSTFGYIGSPARVRVTPRRGSRRDDHPSAQEPSTETNVPYGAAAPPLPATAPAADPPGWPKAPAEQIRVIQQALVDLKLLRDKPDGTLGPMTRSAIRAFQRSVSMRETGEPTVDVFMALQDAARTDTAKSEPADKAQADPALDAWPSATADQVKVIQILLRDLNFSREAPDGVLGPATRAAIRDYERSLGLVQTGEPSKTLFDSLKEMRGLTAPAPATKSD